MRSMYENNHYCIRQTKSSEQFKISLLSHPKQQKNDLVFTERRLIVHERNHKHFTELNGFDFECSLGSEKATSENKCHDCSQLKINAIESVCRCSTAIRMTSCAVSYSCTKHDFSLIYRRSSGNRTHQLPLKRKNKQSLTNIMQNYWTSTNVLNRYVKI